MKQHSATNTLGKLLDGVAGTLDILLDRYPGDPSDALGRVSADVLAAIADRAGLLALLPEQVDAQTIAALLGRDQRDGGAPDTLRGGRDLVAVLVQAYRCARVAPETQAAIASRESHIVASPAARPAWPALAWVVPFIRAVDDDLVEDGVLAASRGELLAMAEYAAFAAHLRLEFDDPDMVGQSEYRAIYDVCESFFDGEPDHVPAILREFIAIAQAMLERIGESPSGGEATGLEHATREGI